MAGQRPEAPVASEAGRKSEAKAHWREQSLRRHLARPLAERLDAALALIVRVHVHNRGRDRT